MPAENLRDKWLSVGWQRGSFVDLSAHPGLINELPAKLQTLIGDLDEAYLVPVLYDCALVDERFELEPWAQAVVCWPAQENKAFKHGKNPRRIHFSIQVESEGQVSERNFEAQAFGFCQVEREELLKTTPSPIHSWSEQSLYSFLNWISERYRQPTFPDSWNERLQTRNRQLERLWKSQNFNAHFSGVYLSIEPFSEISPDETYTVSAFITYPASISGPELRRLNKEVSPEVVQRLNEILRSLSNVEVTNVDTISEDEFTKTMERQHKRLQLEYYSFRQEPAAALPAEI